MTQHAITQSAIPSRCVAFLAALVLLSGCSSSDLTDLQTYVQKIKASKQGHVEPLPEFMPTENFDYSAASLDDPFVSWEDKIAKQQAAQQTDEVSQFNSFSPDLRRRREPMESYPLDTLRMVGTMEREGEKTVLVKTPDGLISRVNIGNYLGQNFGKVLSIQMDKIDLIEIIPDGLGGWLERPASLALVE